MATLDGKTALVLGGAGEVGEGIVRGLLAAGATVAVPSRSEERLASLRARLGSPARLLTVLGDVGRPQGLAVLSGRLESDCPPLDAVVASLGGRWQGPRLVELSVEMWEQILRGSLTAHFLAARTFLPLVSRRKGTYIFINGDTAQPVAGSAPISVASAAQLMLMRTFAAEDDGQARILSLVLTQRLASTAPAGGPAGTLTADAVGERVARLVAEDGEPGSGAVVTIP
jgi:NAD(P)-dependent dehydrogenase (short-subunit alcohol dehydrogenase family)